jgi:hypothetical protein
MFTDWERLPVPPQTGQVTFIRLVPKRANTSTGKIK